MSRSIRTRTAAPRPPSRGLFCRPVPVVKRGPGPRAGAGGNIGMGAAKSMTRDRLWRLTGLTTPKKTNPLARTQGKRARPCMADRGKADIQLKTILINARLFVETTLCFANLSTPSPRWGGMGWGGLATNGHSENRATLEAYLNKRLLHEFPKNPRAATLTAVGPQKLATQPC